MLEDLRRDERKGDANSRATHKSSKSIRGDKDRTESESEELVRTQWTVKGIDQDTLDLSRKAARKRGMKFGAWVNEVLRAAASEEDSMLVNASKELMTKIAEIEFKLDQKVGALIEKSSDIQHDVRVLQLLMPKSATK